MDYQGTTMHTIHDVIGIWVDLYFRGSKKITVKQPGADWLQNAIMIDDRVQSGFRFTALLFYSLQLPSMSFES
jgi:hypothetical protein